MFYFHRGEGGTAVWPAAWRDRGRGDGVGRQTITGAALSSHAWSEAMATDRQKLETPMPAT